MAGLFTASAEAAPNEAITERAIVKTHTLYNFPQPPEPTEPAPASQTAPAVPTQYVLAPGDVLEFQLYDDDAARREVTIRYDGYISLPYIEDQKVAGLDRESAAQCIRHAYQSVFRKPKISLAIKQAAGKTFYVLGAVDRPNKYPYDQPLSVIQAVNLAGGPRIDTAENGIFIGAQSQLTKACIIRHQNGQRDVLHYDLTGLCHPGDSPADAPVLPGDIVYVPEGLNLVYVMGEVVRPSVYPLRENTTLLEVLARAGGAIEKNARMRSVMILRQIDSENTEAIQIDLRKALKTGYSPRIRPGDIIYVPRGKLVRLYDNMMRFTRLTETVSPLLDLYMQAYEAYYTDDSFDLLFDNDARGALGISALESLGILGR